MSTVNERFAVFAQWIWDQRHTERFIHEWVLTDQNTTDATLPQPPLSLAEAKSLLLSLEELKLVFTRETDMGTAYSPNHVKELEWQDAIKDLRYAVWRRSKSVNLAKRFTIGLILFIASAFVGGVLGAVAKDFYSAKIAPHIQQTNSSQTNAPERK